MFATKRYDHRTVFAEKLQHIRSLKGMKHGFRGWIKTLFDEAENEWIHPIIFIEIEKSNALKRHVNLIAQVICWNFYFLLYVFFLTIAHPMVGYFEG